VAGKCGADVADIVDGMYWAAGVQLYDSQNRPLPLNASPARVVNISFGGSDPCNAAYQTAINDLATRGVVVVAAAGNEHGAVSRPASCAGVVGVAALNRDGFKTTYSNFGPTIVVSTVGGDYGGDGAWGNLLGDDGLLSVDNAGPTVPGAPQYSFLYGTSFATPVVAGVVSLMLSATPGLTAAQIVNGLRASARPHVTSTRIGTCSAQNPGRCICTKTTCGEGILDAAEAVRYALDPAGYVNPNRSGANIDSGDVIEAAKLGPDLPANPTPPVASSGGGAVSVDWLVALLLAVVAVGWVSHRRRAS
jgi:serine protease